MATHNLILPLLVPVSFERSDPSFSGTDGESGTAQLEAREALKRETRIAFIRSMGIAMGFSAPYSIIQSFASRETIAFRSG